MSIRSVLKCSLSRTGNTDRPAVAFDAGCLSKFEPSQLHTHLRNVVQHNVSELDKLTKLHMQALLVAYGENTGNSAEKASALRVRVLKAIKEKSAFSSPLVIANKKK